MSTFADVMGAHYDKCAANPVSAAYDELTLVPPKYEDPKVLWAGYPQDGRNGATPCLNMFQPLFCVNKTCCSFPVKEDRGWRFPFQDDQ